MCWIRVTLFQKSYHFLNLVLSPRSKSGGPKRTSQPGQEDGRKKKRKKSFLRCEFCRTKTPIFLLFWKFEKLAILIGEFLRENGAYRKNGVYHDEANGKCKKTVISDFWFSNFRHRVFSLWSTQYLIFLKIRKNAMLDEFDNQFIGTS